MGVGRRMKKQGPPAALDETVLNTIKKRKAAEAERNNGGALHSKKRRVAPSEPKKAEAPIASHHVQRGPEDGGKKETKKLKSALKKPARAEVDKSAVKKDQAGRGRGQAAANGAGGVRKTNGKKNSTKAKSDRGPLSSKGKKGHDESKGDGDVSATPDDRAVDGQNGADGDDEVDLDDKDDFLGLGSSSSVYDSGDDEAHAKALFSEDDDQSDAEAQLTAANIEGLSRKLDAQHAEDDALAQAELEEAALQTNIVVGDAEERPKIFADADEGDDAHGPMTAATALLAPDLQLLRTRITDAIRVLDRFPSLAEEGRSRAEYTAQVLQDICAYYGYSPYLAEKLFKLFPPREAFAFFEANETPRPVVIRTNTLRTHRRELAQALINRGVSLEPVGKWSKVGLQVFESPVPLGATPEYLAGQYMLQSAASFLPVMALAPQEHERVLDMAAAPGGKTTYMAALMKNTGCIFANDGNKARCKALVGNLHRLGVKNTIVSQQPGQDFPRVMAGFDRVLLDAPCSGTGVISKDGSVKSNRTAKDFQLLPHRQRQLLLCAIDATDHASSTGGYVVYSTCSVAVEENEQVVQYALRKRPNVKLVDSGLPFGRDGFAAYMGKRFDPRMKLTRRFYPHTFNVDGFFVAKLKKTGPSIGSGGAAGGPVAATPLDAEVELAAESEGDTTTAVGDADADADAKAKANANGRGVHGPPTTVSLFNDDDDEAYILKGQRAALRRKGLNPKILLRPRRPRRDTAAAGVEADAAAKEEEGGHDAVEVDVDVADGKPTGDPHPPTM
ncbi:MAG: rRNA (cytosine-C5-)-methyltransferase nop2 [Phylliscum demangeonii]|nr:MAG: rRNA (cytosine-C5-)-methyltransferase nop2 [Phylliscum demangeonii]